MKIHMAHILEPRFGCLPLILWPQDFWLNRKSYDFCFLQNYFHLWPGIPTMRQAMAEALGLFSSE